MRPGLRCARSQWSSIGALTHRGPQIDDEIVDVEALLLASLGLARREPRLRTLATDWTLENSELLSIARIRALLEGPFAGTASSIGEVAHLVVTDAGDMRWRALVPADGEPSAWVSPAMRRIAKAMPPRWRGARTLLLQTSGGHSRAYRADIGAWKTLLPNLGSPIWRRRADGFAFALRWQGYLDAKEASHDSELSLAISFGARMTEFWRLWLEAGVTQEPVSDDPANVWASRNDAIESLMRWFEDRAHYGDEYDGRR